MNNRDFEKFVGHGNKKYLNKLKSYSDSKFKGYNFAAMFFPASWMVYRKMYVGAILVHIASWMLYTIITVFFALRGVRFTGGIVTPVGLAFGFVANMLYAKKASRVLKKASTLDRSAQDAYIKRKGGVSVVAVLVLGAIELTVFLWLRMR